MTDKIQLELPTGTVIEHELFYPYAVIHSVTVQPGAKPGCFSRSIRQFVKQISRDRNIKEVVIGIDNTEHAAKIKKALLDIGFACIDYTYQLNLYKYLTTKRPKATIIGRDVHEFIAAYTKLRGKTNTAPDNIANVLISLGEYLLDKDIPESIRSCIERDMDDLTI